MLFLLSPTLRHFVTPLLKERLFGSHCGVLSVMPTVVWLCYFYYRHHSVTSWHLSSRRGSLAPIEGSCQHSWLRGGYAIFIIANTPSLRDTSPQGEAFRLPLRGAVNTVDWWVAFTGGRVRRPILLGRPMVAPTNFNNYQLTICRGGHRPPTRFIYIYCISKGTLNFSVPFT